MTAASLQTTGLISTAVEEEQCWRLGDHVVTRLRVGSSTRRLRKRAALAMREGGMWTISYSSRDVSIRYLASVCCWTSTSPALEFLRRKWRGSGREKLKPRVLRILSSICRISPAV